MVESVTRHAVAPSGGLLFGAVSPDAVSPGAVSPGAVSPEERAREAEQLERRFSAAGRLQRELRRRRRILARKSRLQGVRGIRRLTDTILALGLLVLALPLLVLAGVMAGMGRYPLFVRTRCAGRYLYTFSRLALTCPDNQWGRLLRLTRLCHVPVLFNILRGHMAFVGPRGLDPDALDPADRAARRRSRVRPGVVGLWWLRNRGNVAYAPEFEIDQEYVRRAGLRTDLGIALRAVPAALYGSGEVEAPDRIRVLGIPIQNVTLDEALDVLEAHLAEPGTTQVCFVNADCANVAHRHPAYRRLLQQTEHVWADGIGMKLAGRLLDQHVRENVNGTDLFPRLLERLENTGRRLYLLGARPGVPEAVQEHIARHHPGVQVCGVQHGYFTEDQEPAVVDAIREARADVLLVAFGAPRQDLWIARHLDRLGVKVAMGVGGLLDFYSGRISRAPEWMREIGLEWLYRFLMEPRRMWKRYFVGNAVFLGRVLREKRRSRRGRGRGSGRGTREKGQQA